MGRKRFNVIATMTIFMAVCFITACGTSQEPETDDVNERIEQTEDSADFSYTFQVERAPKYFSDDINISFYDMDANPYPSDDIEIILSKENDYQAEAAISGREGNIREISFSSGNDFAYLVSWNYVPGEDRCNVKISIAEASPLSIDCTDEQEEIMVETVSGMLYELIDFYPEQTNITVEDLNENFLVEYLYEILIHAGEDSHIVTFLGTDSDSYRMYDKESALSNISDIFWETVTEEDIDSYNEIFSKDNGEDLIKVSEDTLSVSDKSRDDTAISCVDIGYLFGETTLNFFLDYKIEANVDDEKNYKEVLAYFTPNQNSFLRYSFDSFTMWDEEYEERPDAKLTGEKVTYEGQLYYEAGDAETPLKFRQYMIDAYDSEGNYVDSFFLKDDQGVAYNPRDQQEWDLFDTIRVKGELDDQGGIWVEEITPLTVWDPDTGEVVAVE